MRLPGLPRRSRPAATEAPWFREPDDPTVDLLDRFAGGPLAPDPAALTRVGSSLQAAFREASRERAATARPSYPHSSRRMRTLAAACAVTVLVVATAGLAAAESGPGEPFYRTRLAIEAVFLPAAGSPARLDADVSRAEDRLAEASRAAAAANWNAEADAMAAYVDVVSSILMPSDSTRRQLLLQQLARQLAGLEGLLEGAHGSVAAEVGQAIERIDQLTGAMPELTLSPDPTGNGPTATPRATTPGATTRGAASSAGQGSGGSSGNGPGASQRQPSSFGPQSSPSPARTANGPRGSGSGSGSGSGGPAGQ